LLGLMVAPAEQAHEVGRGDAAVVLADVGEDLALVAEWIPRRLRRAEDEVEDRVDELLLRPPEAPLLLRLLDRATPRIALVVAAAVVGHEEPPEPAEAEAAVAVVPPPVVAAEHHRDHERDEREDVDDQGDGDPGLEDPHADAGQHAAGGVETLGEGRLVAP